MSIQQRIVVMVVVFAGVISAGAAAYPAAFGQGTIPGEGEAISTIYLPAISRFDPPTATPTLTPAPTRTPTPTATRPAATATPGTTPVIPATPPAASLRRINAPLFAGDVAFEQMGIFWFGRLAENSNYADVRVGYNSSGLKLYLAAFDRRLWYDESPSAETLTDWDAVTVLIDTDPASNALTTSAYRFVAQLSGDPSAAHRAVYQGSAQGWQRKSLPFDTAPGWRGERLNDDTNDRGWAMTLELPFANLGLGTPAPGSEWRLAILLHDRDGANQSPEPVQSWPEAAQRETPITWGRLRFGLPGYTPSTVAASGAALIRRPTERDSAVPDADVGSAITNQCPGDTNHIWNEWANRNYGSAPDFNIQNQADVADWPCFAKYYVTFPLSAIPPGKVIISATLSLHQFGNAGPANEAESSWIQVLTTAEDWQERTITWNNAPLAWENVGGRWVTPMRVPLNWPGVRWDWDVSYAVANAYRDGQPLVRLILYEADAAYHSGKYFVSSDTGDWNIEGRPALRVVWGNP